MGTTWSRFTWLTSWTFQSCTNFLLEQFVGFRDSVPNWSLWRSSSNQVCVFDYIYLFFLMLEGHLRLPKRLIKIKKQLPSILLGKQREHNVLHRASWGLKMAYRIRTISKRLQNETRHPMTPSRHSTINWNQSCLPLGSLIVCAVHIPSKLLQVPGPGYET